MKKFRGQYRIPSARLRGWDYGAPGYYSITITVRGRHPIFGHVVDGKMVLSQAGQIAHQFMVDIPQHFQNASVDTFVIMPDHVHAIIHILWRKVEEESVPKFGRLLPGSLPKIVQAYKAAVTRRIRMEGNPDFEWQPRYYDHIIRNKTTLKRHRRYILNNPKIWENGR
jgi:REP element-mobilizing transposase RayT